VAVNGVAGSFSPVSAPEVSVRAVSGSAVTVPAVSDPVTSAVAECTW
jgi:hypothetical protein